MNQPRSLVAALVLAATAGLAACGGGAEADSAGPGPSETLLHRSGDAGRPSEAGGAGMAGLGSAAASPSAFIAYVRALVDQESERRKPVKLKGFEPPVSETAEPVPLS